MLTQKTFISGMSALVKGYVGWQFNLNDTVQVNFWYAALKNLTDEQFNWVIKNYYAHHKKPPTCVSDLTDVIVDNYYNKARIKPEGALDYVREVISKHGGWEYGGKKKIYNELAQYPALLETVKEFEDTIKNMSANDTYAADRFRKAYEVKLRASAIRRVDKELGLALPSGEKKVLGSGTLPYEE